MFRLYLEAQLNGFYGDNIPFRTTNEVGDFGSAMVAGFYLDYTSDARYASLHYDTFAQLFAHQSQFDRAGEGQFVSAIDDENLSPTTKLHLDEFFYRDATAVMAIVTSDQSPQFNSSLALLLLASDQASANWFNTELYHDWGRNWSSVFTVSQATLWANNTNGNTSYYQGIGATTEYQFNNRFSLGAGYRFYDFMFSLPGLPDEQAHWPFARATWRPMKNLYLSVMAGVVISHIQGTSGQTVNPGVLGGLGYHFYHGRVSISGGRSPSLTSASGGAGQLSGVSGNIFYNFTPRLTGSAGLGFYESSGPGFNGQIISWGFGLSDRVNKWLSVNTRFIQLRRNETASSQFLPSGTQSGRDAVGDYIVVGLSVSFEAFRWSWQ